MAFCFGDFILRLNNRKKKKKSFSVNISKFMNKLTVIVVFFLFSLLILRFVVI